MAGRVQQAFASEVESSRGGDVVRTTRYVRAEVTVRRTRPPVGNVPRGPVILYFAVPPAVTEQHAGP